MCKKAVATYFVLFSVFALCTNLCHYKLHWIVLSNMVFSLPLWFNEDSSLLTGPAKCVIIIIISYAINCSNFFFFFFNLVKSKNFLKLPNFFFRKRRQGECLSWFSDKSHKKKGGDLDTINQKKFRMCSKNNRNKHLMRFCLNKHAAKPYLYFHQKRALKGCQNGLLQSVVIWEQSRIKL